MQFERFSDFFAPPQAGARVVEVTGYTAGQWGKDEWDDCRGRYDIFVGTPEVFRQALIDTGFLRLEDFSLFVVDECHHVSGESDAAALMAHLHCDAENERPRRKPHARVRVLGLTASIVKCKAEQRHTFEEHRQALVDAMQARIEVCRGPPRYPPKFRKVDFQVPPEGTRCLAERLCRIVLECVTEHGVKSSEKAFQKIIRASSVVLEQLGRDAFVWSLEHGIVPQIEAKIDDGKAMPETERHALFLEGHLDALREGIGAAMVQVKQEILDAVSVKAVSDKVKAVVGVLRGTFADQQLHGMVFVSEVSLAMPLAKLLQDELRMDVEVTSGTGSMKEQDRNDAFWRFRTGKSRLLVCTNCAEEGVDVSACAFVVRFSAIHTSKAHIQGAGRARLPRATIFYVENDPPVEIQRAGLMQEVAADESLPGPSPAAGRLPVGFERIPGMHPYVCPSTGAQVNFSAKLLWLYVAKLTSGQATIRGRTQKEEDAAVPKVPLLVDASHAGGPGLVLPGPGGGCVLAEADARRFFEGAPRAAAVPPGVEVQLFYVALLVLRRRGWLDEHNRVPSRVLREAVWPVEVKDGTCRRWCWSQAGGRQGCSEACASPRQRGCRPDTATTGPSGCGSRAARSRPSSAWSGWTRARSRTRRGHLWKTFSDGQSVFKLMVALALGESKVTDFPAIRVSFDERSRQWFSADNRRCFVLKVVAPLIELVSVEVEQINWTSEMDNKLAQRTIPNLVWATTPESVDEVRQEVRDAVESASHGAAPKHDRKQDVADPLAAALAAEVAERLEETGAGAQSAAAYMPAQVGRARPRLALTPYALARAAQPRGVAPTARCEGIFQGVPVAPGPLEGGRGSDAGLPAPGLAGSLTPPALPNAARCAGAHQGEPMVPGPLVGSISSDGASLAPGFVESSTPPASLGTEGSHQGVPKAPAPLGVCSANDAASLAPGPVLGPLPLAPPRASHCLGRQAPRAAGPMEIQTSLPTRAAFNDVGCRQGVPLVPEPLVAGHSSARAPRAPGPVLHAGGGSPALATLPGTEYGRDRVARILRNVQAQVRAQPQPRVPPGPRLQPPAAPQPAPRPAKAPLKRDASDCERVLGLVARDLARAVRPGELARDPVSVLNLAVMGHFKPHSEGRGEDWPAGTPRSRSAEALCGQGPRRTWGLHHHSLVLVPRVVLCPPRLHPSIPPRPLLPPSAPPAPPPPPPAPVPLLILCFSVFIRGHKKRPYPGLRGA
ncbi:unnamed protein product, partial [Prorocentrum cordatum]